MTTFGEELLRVRKERGMTQEQLAAALQTSRSNISHWENGRTLPDLDTARRLSQVLDYNFFAAQAGGDALGEAPEAPAVPPEDTGSAQEPAPEAPLFPASEAPAAEAPAHKPRRVKPWMLFTAAALVAALSLLLVLLPRKNTQGEAQVIFAPVDSVVYQSDYVDIGRGWKMFLTMRNESDVPFSPEKMLIRFYKGETERSLLRLNTQQLLLQMESDTLIQGEATAVYNIGSNDPLPDRAVATLLGTDANGHAQQYTCEVTLSHDAAPKEEE